MLKIPSNVDASIVGSSCLFVNTGVNEEKIPIMNTNINATIILIIMPHEKMLGGTPMNNTENIAPSVNMNSPLVIITIDLYLLAYSMYGPSITSLFALIIENGYSFKIIMYPMKNTMAAIPPLTLNKNGPCVCWNMMMSLRKMLLAAVTGANSARYSGNDP